MEHSSESTNERVIRRIRSLLELSRNSAATEHEAHLAMQRAQEMLDRHNLTEASIPIDSRAEPKWGGHRYSVSDTIHLIMWRRVLIGHLGRLNFVEMFWYNQQLEITMFGQEHNVVAVQVMYEYISAQLTRLAEEAYAAIPGKRPYRIRWMAAFYQAAVYRVNQRLVARRAEDLATHNVNSHGQSGTALVRVLDQELARQYAAFKESRGIKRITIRSDSVSGHAGATQAGLGAGDRVNIDRALSDERPRPAARLGGA